MSFIRGIADKLRGGLRFNLTNGLRELGIPARVARRGRREETIAGGLMGNSLGVVEVRGFPIRWINIIEHPGSRFAPTTYSNVYLVPDEQVHAGGYFDMKSVPLRSAAVHGRVIDLRWETSFTGTMVPPRDEQLPEIDPEQRLAGRFAADTELRDRLIRLGETVRIRSVPNYWCWAISTGSYEVGGSMPESPGMVPTTEQWDCLIAIARHLLEFSASG